MSYSVIGMDKHGRKIRYQNYEESSDAYEHLVALKKTYPQFEFKVEESRQKGTSLSKAINLCKSMIVKRRDQLK
jgi:hypothetical protein